MTGAQQQPGTTQNPGGTNNPFGVSGTPGSQSSNTSNQEKLYTQSQVDGMIHAAKSDAGREVKRLKDENINLQTQIDINKGELEDIHAEKEQLRKDFENASSNDPARFDIAKKQRELADKERQLRADSRKLTADRAKVDADLKRANELNSVSLIGTIAGEYEGSDAKWLSDYCSKHGITSEDAIRELANAMWKKPAGDNQQNTQQNTNQTTVFPGHTDGGGVLNREELIAKSQNAKNMSWQERQALKDQLTKVR